MITRYIYIWVCCLFYTFNCAFGQININEPKLKTESDYRDLVKETLIGSGVLTGHFDVKAAEGSIALFDFDTEKDLVKNGLVLSTGKVSSINGPNDTTNTSYEFFTEGDEDLGNLIGRLTGDAVSIEFDFIPFADSVGFYYFFASEEYPEYVGKGFNDAFAFLIKGPGYPYYTNIAKIEVNALTIPISIDNINFIANKEYFVSNHLQQDKKLLKPKSWQKQLEDPSMLNEIEFDGMTTKLKARAKVKAGEVYSLKIVIADVGDLRYDSGVFLEKESFGSPTDRVMNIDTLAMLKQFAYHYRNEPILLKEFIELNPKLIIAEKEAKHLIDTLTLNINFKNDSFQLSFKERIKIKQAINKLSKDAKYNAFVEGHTDNNASETYNLRLARKRALNTSKLISENGITIKRIDSKGELAPIDTNKTEEGRAKNRRVEVVFIRQE